MESVKKRGTYKPKQNNEIKLSSYLMRKGEKINKK